ncbi:TIGR01777 family oxidoreductase [Desulfobaculum sp.]
MRVIIIGGTGFIGRRLCVTLKEKGHNVVVTSRSPERAERLFSGHVTAAGWDGADPDALARVLDAGHGPQAVVNLAGDNIASGRWTQQKKARILDSRVRVGSALAAAVAKADAQVQAVVQGSAVGYYGPQASADDKELAEDLPAGPGFLAEVCTQWEAAVAGVAEHGVRVAYARTGIVLGMNGGVLERFLPPFKMYVGGPLGGGGQWFPWVHVQDEVGALAFLVDCEDAQGAFNLSAPGVVRMRDFCKELGRALDRPSWLNVPRFALRLAMGEMADEMILSSIRAVPRRLVEKGFVFRYPFLQDALEDIIND